jgi:hypothetical protein
MKDLRLGMTKGSFKTPEERSVKRGLRHKDKIDFVATQRIKSSTRGLGWWAAFDYLNKMNPGSVDFPVSPTMKKTTK